MLRDRKAFIPWSYGAHSCVGKHFGGCFPLLHPPPQFSRLLDISSFSETRCTPIPSPLFKIYLTTLTLRSSAALNEMRVVIGRIVWAYDLEFVEGYNDKKFEDELMAYALLKVGSLEMKFILRKKIW